MEFQPDFFNLQITVMFFNLLVLIISRWIHAKCEGLDGEQYQVLSLLPDTVEYICRWGINNYHNGRLFVIKSSFLKNDMWYVAGANCQVLHFLLKILWKLKTGWAPKLRKCWLRNAWRPWSCPSSCNGHFWILISKTSILGFVLPNFRFYFLTSRFCLFHHVSIKNYVSCTCTKNCKDFIRFYSLFQFKTIKKYLPMWLGRTKSDEVCAGLLYYAMW